MSDHNQECQSCGEMVEGNYGLLDHATGRHGYTYQCTNMTCLEMWDEDENEEISQEEYDRQVGFSETRARELVQNKRVMQSPLYVAVTTENDRLVKRVAELEGALTTSLHWITSMIEAFDIDPDEASTKAVAVNEESGDRRELAEITLAQSLAVIRATLTQGAGE